MVAVLQIFHLRLVVLGIFFQAGNPLFNAVAEAGADLKIFTDCTVGHHGGLLQNNPGWLNDSSFRKNFLEKLKYFSSVPIVARKDKQRQITRTHSKVIRLLGNETNPEVPSQFFHRVAGIY